MDPKTLLLTGLMMATLGLTGCDTGKDNAAPAPAPAGENGEPAPEPAPVGPPHGYQEHMISGDRYQSTKELTYISPVDGKTIICVVHTTGVGAGNDCRVKE